MTGFARRLVRHPRLVVVASVVVTALLGVYAVQLRIESSLESVLPAGDPAVAYYAQVRALFGSDDVAVVGVRAPDLFSPATLTRIDQVTNALAKVAGVERVFSLTNAVDPGADVINPPRLLPRIPPTDEDIAALRQKLISRPLFRRNLVAADDRGTAINVFLRPMSDAEYAALDIDTRIQHVLATAGGPERFYYTGAARVKQAAVEMIRRDLFRFTPVALLLIVLVLWLSFRTKRGVVLPVVTVLGALVWTLGVMVLAGRSITIGTFVLPPLLLVIGSSYAIHVMARYYEQIELGYTGEEVVLRAFERVWLPLVISALTNAIGFGSLMVNRIPAIWELGCFAVVGVVILTIASLTFLPAMLASMPVERRGAASGRVTPWLVQLLGRLGTLAYTSQRAILLGSVAVAALAVWGMTRIEVDSDFLYYFRPTSRVRQDTEVINREIVGSNPFYIVVEGKPALLRQWWVLREIRDLQRFLGAQPGVTSSISVVDYLELLESGLTGSGAGDLVVDDKGNVVPVTQGKSFWDDPQALAPVLAMVSTSPETFKGVVTPDFAKASILVRTSLSGSRAVETTLRAIRAYIAEHFPAAEMQVHLTGSLVLLTGTTSDIVAGQVESLTLALVVIFVVMAAMFLSLKIGFLAILPNVLPILLFFGAMGWQGIYLNLGTSLIAAIALGIAVDSTIHYMARLNLELQGETDQAAAIKRALRTVGVPIVYTTAALLLGFLTFAFSGFVPIQNFGILTGITLATALGANLVMLPALLATTKIITLWDLLAVKLGRDPARTIPLFAGLRPAQARVVVLMGEVKRFEPGQSIVRQGEQGDEMYVIIQGNTEVWAGSNADRRRIRELKRGDVFGEMALVRQSERSADVVAAGPVEVLAVDQRFLDRIQRRYPRIASRVFLNLTRILSDRLEHTTTQFVTAQR